MNSKQKSFLDGLAELCREYSVDHIEADYSCIRFVSNNKIMSVGCFIRKDGKAVFLDVGTKEDYVPENPPERYTGEEFDD